MLLAHQLEASTRSGHEYGSNLFEPATLQAIQTVISQALRLPELERTSRGRGQAAARSTRSSTKPPKIWPSEWAIDRTAVGLRVKDFVENFQRQVSAYSHVSESQQDEPPSHSEGSTARPPDSPVSYIAPSSGSEQFQDSQDIREPSVAPATQTEEIPASGSTLEPAMESTPEQRMMDAIRAQIDSAVAAAVAKALGGATAESL